MEPTLPPSSPPETEPPTSRLDHRQRVVLAVLGGLAAALVVALVLAALLTDDADEAVVTGATTSSTASTVPEDTTTTVDLPTSTTGPTTTTRPTTTTTTTTTQPPRPVVDGRGAVLVAPSTATRRQMSDGRCETLAAEGWGAECGLFRGKGNVELAWLVETRTVGEKEGVTARRAYVFRRVSSGRYASVLEATDEDGTRFADVNVRVVDVSGDGAAEAVFGFHRPDVLAVDVVEGPGTVVVHRDARRGSARVSPGQLDVWEAAGSQFDHLTIRFSDNAWRIVANVKQSPGQVPPSQL